MQIQLKQEELEIALRDYVLKMGLIRPIESIEFTAARSQGGRIMTEINLGELSEYIPNGVEPVSVPVSGTVSDSQSPAISKEAAPAVKEEVSIGTLISDHMSEVKDTVVKAGKPLFGG